MNCMNYFYCVFYLQNLLIPYWEWCLLHLNKVQDKTWVHCVTPNWLISKLSQTKKRCTCKSNSILNKSTMPDTIMEHRLAVCCHDNQPTMYQLTVSDTENAFTWQRMNGAPKLQRMLVLLTANQSTAHNSWISAALWIQKCYFCFPMQPWQQQQWWWWRWR